MPGYFLQKLLNVLAFPWQIPDRVRAKRRENICSQTFPVSWLKILENDVPVYLTLPAHLQIQLQRHIQIFVAEKRFEGCAGTVITDQIKITIAAQACLLLLNRPPTYYSRMTTILVYPAAFVVEKVQRMGVTQFIDELAVVGQAWSRDYVILSWDDVKHGAADVNDGCNVVLHEFAHQLDNEDSKFDGVPLLEQRSQYVTWARVLSKEYANLCSKLEAGHSKLVGDYAAQNPAEFFAVVTEIFFEKPKQLKKRHPELFEAMRKCFNVDPTTWG